jgi:hypothetical protein
MDWLDQCLASKQLQGKYLWVLSFQISPKRMASLRATATRARFGPRRFISLRPQLLSADGLLTVVRSTFAASPFSSPMVSTARWTGCLPP